MRGHANIGRCGFDDFVQRFFFFRRCGVRLKIVNAQESMLVCISVSFHHWFQFIWKNSRPVRWWNCAYCLFADKNGLLNGIHQSFLDYQRTLICRICLLLAI